MFPLKGDPLGVPRNPLAIYLLILAAITGLGILVGITTAGSITAVPVPAAFTWGAILFGGSTATLLGVFWQGDVRTGLALKRAGTFSVGTAALIYAVIVGIALGTGGLFAAGTIAGFGIACFIHFHTINDRIHAIIAATKAEETDQ